MIPPAKDNPKPAHPILLVLLFIENLLASLSGDARKVNHNFDTQTKNSYPLAKRLEGRADGTLVQKGNRGDN